MVFIAASIYKFLFEAMLKFLSKNRKAYIYPPHNNIIRCALTMRGYIHYPEKVGSPGEAP